MIGGGVHMTAIVRRFALKQRRVHPSFISWLRRLGLVIISGRLLERDYVARAMITVFIYLFSELPTTAGTTASGVCARGPSEVFALQCRGECGEFWVAEVSNLNNFTRCTGRNLL